MAKELNDYISICSVKNVYTQVHITSKSKWFIPNEDVIVKVDDEKMLITRPSIDYNGKTYRIKPTRSGWFGFHIVAEITLGNRFLIDTEESNEDQLVIYYK